MASADARGAEMRDIATTNIVKKMVARIDSSSSSEEEEAAISRGAVAKEARRREDKGGEAQRCGEEGKREEGSTIVAKTKEAVKEVGNLLTLIRESASREKAGKIAFLKEDQLVVKNATFDIQSEVQKLMLLILEAREAARKAEEGRMRAEEEARRLEQAAKVSPISLVAGRKETGRRQGLARELENRVGNQQEEERAPVWQGARPKTGIWATSQAGQRTRPAARNAAGEGAQPGTGRVTGPGQGARGEELQRAA